MSDWQPIETAPKVTPPGKQIIIADKDGRMLFMEWLEDGRDEEAEPWSGWVLDDGFSPDDHPEFIPAHWMLIDLPPEG